MASDGHRHAVVTLVTSDSYLAGALVALNSLLDAESASASPTARAFATVCLATPASLAHSTVQALERAFDVVIGVEPILTRSWEELALLGEAAPSPTLPTPLAPGRGVPGVRSPISRRSGSLRRRYKHTTSPAPSYSCCCGDGRGVR